MAVIVLKFVPKRDTKNTILFQEVEAPDKRYSEPKGYAIGPMYMQTDALKELTENPMLVGEITVTIEVSKNLQAPRAKMG